MRYLHVTVPTGLLGAVTDVLEDRSLDYAVTEEAGDGDYEAIVSFPAPIEAVDPLLTEFRRLGLEDSSHVVVQDAEAIVSSDYGETERRYDDLPADERIAHEEIRTVAKELVPDRYTFGLLTVASAVVATAGLLLDSASIVVGSMVIAPLVGPALSTGVGTVLDDRELFAKGTRYQLGGYALAVLSSTLFALLVKRLFLIPPNVEITAIEQIAGRLSPDLLALVVALGAGAAGARSLETDVSTPLVGVMMAAALVPPTAAAGIGIAWGLPNVVLRAGLLVLVNALSINFCALVVLWYSGYRSEDLGRRDEARQLLKERLALLVIGILLLSTVLGVFTMTAYQTGASTETIRTDVQDVLDQPRYENLSLVDVTIEHRDRPFPGDPSTVVVTVTTPHGRIYDSLDEDIQARIRNRTGRSLRAQVRFIGVDTADPSTGTTSPEVRPDVGGLPVSDHGS